jgi:release factor glutamine methyltransferase
VITEELCGWVLSEKSSLEQVTGGCSILDVGTGSGCIAITLAAGIPQAKVTAWDLSDGALQVARMNAKRICVDVSFVQMDALNIPHTSSSSGSGYDIIVSNPPYIINKERANMEANVLDYEPHNALFVPDNDPLRFYRAISQYALVALRTDGWLYFEINPLYAEDLKLMLQTMGFHSIEVKKDQYGKQRMMRARR